MFSKKHISFIAGIVIPAILFLIPRPTGLSSEGLAALAVTLLMAIWWMTEAVPIYITAFIPVALFPLFGIMSSKEASLNFGNNYVLMLLCGFFLAKAIEVQNLHKRIALTVLNKLGVEKRFILLSFMLISAFLSMWIANVAVVLLMLPIANAVIYQATEKQDSNKAFAFALLLGIAYACSIGGTATLIGTPVNMVFVGVLEKLYPLAPEISFFAWFKVGLPICLVFLPIIWFYLIKWYKIEGSISSSKTLFHEELKSLGRMSNGEWKVLVLFILTALGWIFRSNISIGNFQIPGWSNLLGLSNYVHDSTVVIITSTLLFVLIDTSTQKPLLNWKQAQQIPWGVVMIVSGGYCIASGFQKTGIDQWIGQELSFIGSLPAILIVLFIVSIIIFLTEINSNTATANIFLPLLAAIAVASSTNPLFLLIPATFACSFAFMMPSGTGTNTVIFASEKIDIKEMVKTGFGLNIISIIVLTVLVYLLVIPLLGISQELPYWAITK